MMNFIKKLMVLVCMMLLLCTNVYAAELSAVMSAYTADDAITLFLRNQDSELSHVYIGNEECLEYTVDDIGAIRTVVILDNSLSIQEKYRESIKTFLTDIVAARNDGDVFTIATFAKDITYLVQESNDYLDIKNKIDSFEFIDQETFFSKTLYDVIDDTQQNEDIRYSRVIIIADGADYEDFGYTDEELHKKIRAAHIPIYTIGCSTENNSDNLKEMFSLSRMTNAQSYLIDETPLPNILQNILIDINIHKVSIVPPDTLCDGSTKTVRLDFGDSHCTIEMVMPFKAYVSEDPSAVEENLESSTEITLDEEPALVEEPKSDETVPIILIIILVALIFVTAVSTIVLMRKKKKSSEKEKKLDLSGIGHSKNTGIIHVKSSTGTELLSVNSLKTGIISGEKTMKIHLEDIKDSSKTFEYPIRNSVLIGKDRSLCQICIEHNKYISSVHCEVFKKENEFYVRDGNGKDSLSTNGTFVNDKRVIMELPLPSGSILKLGEVSFKVGYT